MGPCAHHLHLAIQRYADLDKSLRHPVADRLRNSDHGAMRPMPMTHRAALIVPVILGILSPFVSSYAAETYQHDAIGRLTDVAYANGSSFHYTYDANGNVLSVITSL